MADENRPQDEENQEQEPSAEETTDESGLGNLPPLSDFESQTSDEGLPPVADFDSTPAESEEPGSGGEAGMPPAGDIEAQTPQPPGGDSQGEPADFGSAPQEQFSSGQSPLDTPTQSSQGGFQDLAADSDFSPETPDIGPGPGSDQGTDTPMFDSAFGGEAQPNLDTPTQPVETPMFGDQQAPAGDVGFDQGAFAPGGGFDLGGGGTPPPDFSPDTGLQPEPAAEQPPAPAPPRRGGGALAKYGLVAALVIAVIGGLAICPYVIDFLPFPPNPKAGQIQTLETQVQQLNREIEQLGTGGTGQPSPEDERLAQEMAEVSESLKSTKSALDSTTAKLREATENLEGVKTQLDRTSQDYVTAKDQFEELKSETTILQARQKGLIAEVDRLNTQVDKLEVADNRRISAKKTLVHDIDRLVIEIKESLPLTPKRFSHAERLAAAQELRALAEEAQWVTPALQDAYDELYRNELAVAGEKAYFFARLTVENEFGVSEQKWCECLMQGNWGVFFRSLDGKNIGVYKNVANEQTPIWGVEQAESRDLAARIEDDIVAARVPDYEQKVAVLAEKELSADSRTPMQRNYDSLL